MKSAKKNCFVVSKLMFTSKLLVAIVNKFISAAEYPNLKAPRSSEVFFEINWGSLVSFHLCKPCLHF